MPSPVRLAAPGQGCAPSPSGAPASSPAAMESAITDYAARDPKEVAKHFPIPSAEVAGRLVDLLVPRHPPQPKGNEAA